MLRIESLTFNWRTSLDDSKPWRRVRLALWENLTVRALPGLLTKSLALILSSALIVLIVPAVASAEDPEAVVRFIGITDGVYVAPSRRAEFDRDAIQVALAEAEDQGLTAAVIVPSDPFPSNDAFALRVRQASEIDLIISFGPDGEIHASLTNESDADVLRALRAARAADTPEGAVAAFLEDMVTEQVQETPSLVGDVMRWAIILVIVLAIAVALEAFFRKRRAINRAKDAHTRVSS